MARARSAGFGEDVGEYGKGCGHDGGRPDPHQDPPGNQLAGRRGRRRQRRAQPEYQQAAREGPMAADAVTEAAEGEQQAGHGQGVGVDDPLQRGGRGVEMPDQGR